MGFTPEQDKAINYRERSAVVSASAGSGKTMVLVEHIAKLISDESSPVSADRLAVVTFTEKAAAELRQRLDSRVSRLLEEKPSEFLQEQLVKLSSARISTISSFCLSLIRDNIRLLPLSLEEGFSVGDETQTKLLAAKAVKKMFRRLYSEFSEEEKAETARRLGGEEEIAPAVEQLHEFLSNIADGESWLEEQLRVFGDPALYEERYVRKAREAAIAVLGDREELRAYAGELMALAAEQSKSADKMTEFFGRYFDKIDMIVSALEKGDNEALLTALETEVGKAPPLTASEYHLKLRDIKDTLKARIEECAKFTQVLPCVERDAEDCGRSLELLWRLERIYSEEYSSLKAAKGIVDFADLERYALQAARLGGGRGMFDYIIVDEFQDSNDIQYELFRLLSRNEENLYFVGDVKQCIYSFRSANPDIFASLLHNEKYEKIILNENFRSSDNVIETANLMLSGKMPRSFSGDGWEDMTAGRKIPASAENKSELVILNYRKEERDISREALYTALRIKEMVEEGFTVHARSGERACHYGDFAVLLRTGSKLSHYRKAFEDAGIPYIAVGEKSFTDLMEIEIAMSILGAVLRPSDDIAVTTALMSPVYGFSAEDMAKLRLADAKRPLYRNLSDMLKEGGLPEGAERFLADMKLLRKAAANTVSHELLQEIYSVTMLPELMSVGTKGNERRENLRLLLHYARSTPRPADFAAQMRTIKRSRFEMPQAQVREQEERSVRIMTIHASKGLQFPVVFIGHCNRMPKKTDFSLPFIFDRKTGAGVMVCDYNKPVRSVTASHLLLQDRLEDRINGEELRLLYVAMTRAEEKLIVTAECEVKEKKGEVDENGDISSWKGSYFDFILNRLEQAPSAMSVTRIHSHKPLETENAETEKGSKRLPDLSELGRWINSEYRYQSAVNTPAKFTATALGVAAGEAGDEATLGGALYMGLPLFMKKNRPLTPKERGDVYHKVMENLDFAAASAEEELSRMQADGTVTEDERRAVDAAELQSFLDGDICRRARGSAHVEREFRIFTTVNKTGLPDPDNDDLSFVQGVADMFFEEDGKIVLVDYKTNRNTTPEKLTEEYKGQLEIYKKALSEMTGLEVGECVLFSFSLKKSIKVL
ncbi:MAG: UvrD-helicase domain-containing protein [Oscillospiraceae bacterium]|nr:UvrD-helicase domain-containing protein [Oscillospiraceae bacterium]